MECQSGEYSKVLCWVWWIRGFPGGTSGKEPTCQCRRWKKHGFNPWVGETPRRRRWQLIPVFLPGESQGQRSLAGYSPRGHIELDTTEATKHSTHNEERSEYCHLSRSLQALDIQGPQSSSSFLCLPQFPFLFFLPTLLFNKDSSFHHSSSHGLLTAPDSEDLPCLFPICFSWILFLTSFQGQSLIPPFPYKHPQISKFLMTCLPISDGTYSLSLLNPE